jgi:hypothetical protein
MPSRRFNAHLNMSHLGPPQPLKDATIVVENPTGIHNVMVKCIFTVKRSCTYIDSNLVSVEAM